MRTIIKKFIRQLTPYKLLALAFLLFISYVGAAALPKGLSALGAALQAEAPVFISVRRAMNKRYADMLSTELTQPALQNKASYINFNGLLARLLGQRHMNERVKLHNGHLSNYGNAPFQIDTASEQMQKLYARQAAQNKHFLFVLAPWQISKYDPQLPVGYQEQFNMSADALLRSLQENNVPVLDLREKMYEQGISHDEAFFITDHHWTPQTAFWAYAEILACLTELHAIPEVDKRYTDAGQYTFRLYENWLLGSSGKRTGQYYAGVDDFHVIIPQFETELSLEIPSAQVYNTGQFEDVAYNKKRLEKRDYFNEDVHGAYGYGDQGIAHWRNENAPIGKKALLIGDSFGNIPFSLLSLCIATCDELDMRHYKGDFQAYYAAYSPDIVIVLVNAEMHADTNTTYDFFPEPAGE